MLYFLSPLTTDNKFLSGSLFYCQGRSDVACHYWRRKLSVTVMKGPNQPQPQQITVNSLHFNRQLILQTLWTSKSTPENFNLHWKQHFGYSRLSKNSNQCMGCLYVFSTWIALLMGGGAEGNTPVWGTAPCQWQLIIILTSTSAGEGSFLKCMSLV